MNTLFEKNGGKYKMQGDYRLPCVALPQDTTEHIGVWGERRRRFLKTQHRVRYYNLLTAGTLDSHLAEKEGVTENLKTAAPMEWVQKMNNIRNRATEIVNAEVVFS